MTSDEKYNLQGESNLGPTLPQHKPQARAEASLAQDYSPEEGVFSNHKVILQVSYVCTPPWTEYST